MYRRLILISRFALTFIACSVLTIGLSHQLICFAAEAPCNSSQAASHLEIARLEQRAHDWRTARRDANLASREFSACARMRSGTDYAESLYGAANAHAIAAIAIVGSGGTRANPEFSRAYAFYRAVASYKGANSIQRRLGSAKAAQLLGLTSPGRGYSADVPRPRSLSQEKHVLVSERPRVAPSPITTYPIDVSTSQPSTTPTVPQLQITILDAWQTTAPGQSAAFQHVKVHLASSGELTVKSSSFRIIVAVNGINETVYGFAGAAPTYQRVNYLSNSAPPTTVSTVEPTEDLGRGPILLHRGDEVTKVVTFIVRGGSQFNKQDQTAIVWLSGR